MAQQTRIETVRPYYARFLERFPTVESLASADLDAVLKAWEGLGYYARARNLRTAARQVVEAHGGRVPGDVEALRGLAGIGPYTAGAIASLAFGRAEPAIDGNARRVLVRLFDVAKPTATRLEGLGRQLLSHAPGRAGALNQAIMDLGSRVCRPRRPHCETCPLTPDCLALARGTVAERPAPKTSAVRRERREAGAVIHKGDEVLIVRRAPSGLLGGLWDFPSVRVPADRSGAEIIAAAVSSRFGVSITVGRRMRLVEHVFSHFRLRLVVYAARWRSGEPQNDQPWRWASPQDLENLAFPVYQRRLISDLLSGGRPDRRRL